jgi:hypothetical protein
MTPSSERGSNPTILRQSTAAGIGNAPTARLREVPLVGTRSARRAYRAVANAIAKRERATGSSDSASRAFALQPVWLAIASLEHTRTSGALES